MELQCDKSSKKASPLEWDDFWKLVLLSTSAKGEFYYVEGSRLIAKEINS